MARWADDSDAVAPELTRYWDADWPDEADPPRAWGAAARRWLAEHPERGLPGWNAAGDPVQVLCAVVRLVMLRLGGVPLVLSAADLAWLVEQRPSDLPPSWPGGNGHAARR